MKAIQQKLQTEQEFIREMFCETMRGQKILHIVKIRKTEWRIVSTNEHSGTNSFRFWFDGQYWNVDTLENQRKTNANI